MAPMTGDILFVDTNVLLTATDESRPAPTGTPGGCSASRVFTVFTWRPAARFCGSTW